MVYPPAGGHPSKYEPGPVSISYVDQSQRANHYTKSTLVGFTKKSPLVSIQIDNVPGGRAKINSGVYSAIEFCSLGSSSRPGSNLGISPTL